MPNLTGFAEACYDDNTITELATALQQPVADNTDCKTWGISAEEWRDAITQALDAKIAKLDGEELSDLLERTEYAESGVAIGAQAAVDQDLRRLAQREHGRRMFGDDA